VLETRILSSARPWNTTLAITFVFREQRSLVHRLSGTCQRSAGIRFRHRTSIPCEQALRVDASCTLGSFVSADLFGNAYDYEPTFANLSRRKAYTASSTGKVFLYVALRAPPRRTGTVRHLLDETSTQQRVPGTIPVRCT